MEQISKIFQDLEINNEVYNFYLVFKLFMKNIYKKFLETFLSWRVFYIFPLQRLMNSTFMITIL